MASPHQLAGRLDPEHLGARQPERRRIPRRRTSPHRRILPGPEPDKAGVVPSAPPEPLASFPREGIPVTPRSRLWTAVTTALASCVLSALPVLPAQAYSPTQGTIYQLPASQPCLKGRGNCAIYPKVAQLPNGRLIASWEQATVPSSGSAA